MVIDLDYINHDTFDDSDDGGLQSSMVAKEKDTEIN